MKNIFGKLFLVLVTFLSVSCSQNQENEKDKSIKEVIDGVITRLYDQVPSDEFNNVDSDFVLNFITEDEKTTLSTKYQYFKVNVPVTVSVMRYVNQKTIPFWLKESGFVNTGKKVKNQEYEYEVWQKDFDKGWVNLGINGFEGKRVVYFISVGAKNKEDKLEITNIYPSEFPLEVMSKGAYMYNDWDELTITEFPANLEGNVLFTTIRGRYTESHIVGGFRKTSYPSSDLPDQILLTWSRDPKNSIDIQWRTNLEVKEGYTKYWLKGTSDTLVAKAETLVMEDRMLYNDRYINRHTTLLTNLVSGAKYEYIVGSKANNSWSGVKSFETESKEDDKFSFIWFGDTHKSKKWGDVLEEAEKRHPNNNFYAIAGDLVSTGLYRSDWDQFFEYSNDAFSQKPLMPVPGNHDRRFGLGSWMYYDYFSLPKNGPEKVAPESTYSFRYGNALFLMIDSTHPMDDQTEWIEDQLKNTDATWKFAMFHFPPYNFEEPYFDLQKNWIPIFDKYHVDFVMSGHIHYYMRSKPMYNGEVKESFADGTIYTVSIGTLSKHDNIGEEPYAAVRKNYGQIYQHVEISGKTLDYTTYNKEGKIIDKFHISK